MELKFVEAILMYMVVKPRFRIIALNVDFHIHGLVKIIILLMKHQTCHITQWRSLWKYVQDLPHASLKINLDDIRKEEWNPDKTDMVHTQTCPSGPIRRGGS